MGSAESKYLETGIKVSNMREFDDSTHLSTTSQKITGIRVWFKDYIDGIQVFYDYAATAPAQHSSLYDSSTCKMGEFEIPKDELLTEISVRSEKAGLNFILFKTDKGTTMGFGEGIKGKGNSISWKNA